MKYTPSDPTILDYILTGKERKEDPNDCILSCCIICDDEWKIELKKIEDKISMQSN